MPYKKIDIERANQMYRAGQTINDIADALDLTPSTIFTIIRESRDGRADHGKIMALWKAGWSIDTIMRECECDEATVKAVVA